MKDPQKHHQTPLGVRGLGSSIAIESRIVGRIVQWEITKELGRVVGRCVDHGVGGGAGKLGETGVYSGAGGLGWESWARAWASSSFISNNASDQRLM
jgi:hypothetical protein